MRPSTRLFTPRSISRLASIFIIIISLLRAGVAGDQSRDAIRPSGDRFPPFALNVLRPSMGSVPVGYGPRRGQLRADKLSVKLGADMDASLMSVTRPPEGTFPSTEVVKERPNVELQEHLSQLNFTYVDDVTGEEQTIRPALRRHVERWLFQRAACPIRQGWVDLGLFFWPRWVRKGSCDTRTSCSWPPGMHCVPQERRPIRLLRWTCTQRRHRPSGPGDGSRGDGGGGTEGARRRAAGTHHHLNGGRKETHCRWKKVRYSITTECYCSC